MNKHMRHMPTDGTYNALCDMTVDVCGECLAIGPVRCAANVIEQAETALLLGRGLLQLGDWPQTRETQA